MKNPYGSILYVDLDKRATYKKEIPTEWTPDPGAVRGEAGGGRSPHPVDRSGDAEFWFGQCLG